MWFIEALESSAGAAICITLMIVGGSLGIASAIKTRPDNWDRAILGGLCVLTGVFGALIASGI